MASLLLNGRETTCFLLHENKARMSALTTIIKYCPEGSSQCNKAKEKIKGLPIGKEEIKLFIHSGMIQYLENSKEPFLLKNKFNKIIGFKRNI